MAELKVYQKQAGQLQPNEAAAQWVKHFSTFSSLSSEQLYSAQSDDGGNLDITTLLKALPQPQAWSKIGELLGQQKSDHHETMLLTQLLSNVMKNEVSALEENARALRKYVEENDGQEAYQKEQSLDMLDRLDQAIAEINGKPDQLAARFQAKVERLEKTDSGERDSFGGSLEIPDLEDLVGPDQARDLLKRILVLGLNNLTFRHDSTRELAAVLALEILAQMKTAQWELVDSVQSAPLFEALEKKFGAKLDDYNYRSAEAFYVLHLISSNRSADAVKRIQDSMKRPHGQRLDLPTRTFDGLGGEAFGIQVLNFLRVLLTENPNVPQWDSFISLSAKYQQSDKALELLQKAIKDPKMTDAMKRQLKPMLVTALLAADRREEGVTALVESVKLGADSAGDKTDSERFIYLPLKLLKLSTVLGRDDLQQQAVEAIRAALADTGRESYQMRSDLESVLESLLKANLLPEAEALAAEHLEKLKKNADSRRGGWESSLDGVLQKLVLVYDKAGRSEDVLALVEESPDWTHADLADILASGSADDAFPLAIARALVKTNRSAEAAPIVRRVLQSHRGSDPAYHLLLETHSKTEVEEVLKKLEQVDRFEERPWIWRAQLLLNDGKLEDAEKAVKTAIDIDPSDGEQGKGDRMRAYAVLGEILNKKGDAAGAAVMVGIIKAIRASEEADDWWQAGLLKEATARYEAALEAFSEAYCVQSRLALRSAEIGDMAKAEKHYQKAFELMPGSFGRIESHCFGCEGAFASKLAQEIAERVFSRLKAEQPSNPKVHYLIGYLRNNQDRYAEAAEAFREAIKLDPDYFNALENLGRLAERISMAVEERDDLALQRFRLDPYGHHGKVSIITPAKLRELWRMVIEREVTPAMVEHGPLFAFTAAKSKARPDHQILTHPNASESGRELIETVPLMQTIAYLMQTIR